MDTTKTHDVSLELLLGRLVVDTDGVKVGHIEEVLAERVGEELLVTHYLVGTYGLFQRLSIHHLGVGLLRLLGARAQSEKPYRIPWDKLDLSDPDHPRLTCLIEEL